MSSTSCLTPRAAFMLVSACSKRCPSTPSTTSPYIWISRRYESYAKRSLPVVFASPATASSLRPRLRIVSIIPGIETAAPERTETSSGSSGSPNRFPAFDSSEAMCSAISASRPVGQLAAGGHVGAAGVGRDREARRHRDAERRHLGEADPLAAEELAPAAGVLVEVVDVAHRPGIYTRPRERPHPRHGRRRPARPELPARGLHARARRARAGPACASCRRQAERSRSGSSASTRSSPPAIANRAI